jgi:hypothetical protein
VKSVTPGWLKWLRACSKDADSQARLPGELGMLTGQDTRALEAIAACWQLYGGSDQRGREAALAAVRALLPAMQEPCRPFARELIAWALDWPQRAELWPVVTDDEAWRKWLADSVAWREQWQRRVDAALRERDDQCDSFPPIGGPGD